MDLDDKAYDRIKTYLDNEMNDDERIHFEKEIKTNNELAENLSILRKMDTIYSDTGWDLFDGEPSKLKETANLFKGETIDTFSKQVKIAESHYRNNNKKSIKHFIKYFSSFAAAILILFIGYHVFIREVSSLDLYNEYYNQKDLPSFTTKSDIQSTLAKAENLFKTKQYPEALALFKSAENNQDTFNPNLVLYIAICHLEIEQYSLAHKNLDRLLQSNTLDFHKAYWFKALTYLKENNKTEAIKILESLINDEKHFNYNKAITLLKALN